MSEEPKVRGRDFVAYRISAAVVALLLLIALAVQTYEIFDHDNVTVPEVSWGWSGAAEGNAAAPEPSGALAAAAIADRTKLQDERWRTGPSPEGVTPPLAMEKGAVDAPIGSDPERLMENRPMNDGRELTESWSMIDTGTAELLRQREKVIGISSLPYPNAENFERPFARDWRLGIADFATHLGALAILGFSLLLALVLAIRGRVPIVKGKSGRVVKRFSFLERANHWNTAVSFIGLALTGIAIAYGDTLIRPFGEETLGAIGWLSTWGHVLFFPSFTVGITLMAIMWTIRNLPSKLDLLWLKKGGGMFTDKDDTPPTRKFNAGQKLIFWSAILGGFLMVASGVTLMFPYYWFEVEGMSWTMLTHAVVGVLLIAIFIGHIYIGTVGMQGAFWAMWGGDVDRNWAEEHHDLWVKEEIDGNLDRSTTPPSKPAGAARAEGTA